MSVMVDTHDEERKRGGKFGHSDGSLSISQFNESVFLEYANVVRTPRSLSLALNTNSISSLPRLPDRKLNLPVGQTH